MGIDFTEGHVQFCISDKLSLRPPRWQRFTRKTAAADVRGAHLRVLIHGMWTKTVFRQRGVKRVCLCPSSGVACWLLLDEALPAPTAS